MQETERGAESKKQLQGIGASNEQPNVIDLLKKDHRNVEKLFQQFKGSSKKSEKREIAQKICSELKVHSLVEEELVYPLIARIDEADAEESYSEHSLVKFMIADILPLRASDKALEPRVKVLEELVKHHVKEEESKTLPELKDTDEDLNALGAKVLTRKGELEREVKGNASKRKVARKSSGSTVAAKTAKKKSAVSKSKRRGSASAKSAASKKSQTLRSTNAKRTKASVTKKSSRGTTGARKRK